MVKLISAKCPNCGASLKLSKEEEIVKCEYCHQNIIVDEAIACYKLKITGLVSVEGIQTNSELITAANELLKMEEYLKAKRKFLEFTEKNPKDYQGWLGLLICRTRNFKIRDNNNLFENDINSYYQHYNETASDEVKEKYKDKLENYFKKDQDDSLTQIKKNINVKIDPNYKYYIFPSIMFIFGLALIFRVIILGGLSWILVGILQMPQIKKKDKELEEFSKLFSIVFIIIGFIFWGIGV